MRIIAGEHRGRVIEAPPGDGTRPTTDRVRESIMSSVYSAKGGFDGLAVLDAFAGSGAMGLESMSRGAAFAVLNDCGKDASRAISKNVQSLGYGPGQVKCTTADVERFGLASLGGPFDVVFLDPPYRMDQEKVLSMVEEAAKSGVLADGCLVVYEHDEPAEAPLMKKHGLSSFRDRKIGKTHVTYINVMGA